MLQLVSVTPALGQGKTKTGRSRELDSQAVWPNLELWDQWETLFQKTKVAVWGRYPMSTFGVCLHLYTCTQAYTGTDTNTQTHSTDTHVHECTLVFHEQILANVYWVIGAKTVFLLGCCSKVKKVKLGLLVDSFHKKLSISFYNISIKRSMQLCNKQSILARGNVIMTIHY